MPSEEGLADYPVPLTHAVTLVSPGETKGLRIHPTLVQHFRLLVWVKCGPQCVDMKGGSISYVGTSSAFKGYWLCLPPSYSVSLPNGLSGGFYHPSR